MKAPAKGSPGLKGEKLGLALSGGGFRASLFHLGVLAQLAERGLLRQVEVISTVSGGSIIGALYYLHVKKLLEGKTDTQISDRDYVDLVAALEQDFLSAVQRNLRMLTFADLKKDFRMFRPNYSHSDRIGELYDEILYRPVMAPDSPEMIHLRDLKIAPKQPNGSNNMQFYPLIDNTSRRAKVPILLINATTLNTGHNWRFEAARMGEADPQKGWCGLGTDNIDQNARLIKAGSYDDYYVDEADPQASPKYFELGLAVAASACVPGIFHPLAISDLYRNYRLQLVDGGVHDNQGVKALLDWGYCNLIISDASGQMKNEPSPQTLPLPVLLRSNSILMDRVREEQLCCLLEDGDREVALVHLRQGLKPDLVPFKGKDGTWVDGGEQVTADELTAFGVNSGVQELLAKVRTDLDAFSDVEAYSLMLDGYLLSGKVLANSPRIPKISELMSPTQTPGEWSFKKIEPWLKNPTRDYLKQLKVASQPTFKIFRLNLPLSLACFAVLATLIWKVLHSTWADRSLLTVTLTLENAIWTALLVGAYFAYGWLRGRVSDLLNRNSRLKSLNILPKVTITWMALALRGIFAVGFWGVAWLHNKFFNRLFLARGKLDRLQPPPEH